MFTSPKLFRYPQRHTKNPQSARRATPSEVYLRRRRSHLQRAPIAIVLIVNFLIIIMVPPTCALIVTVSTLGPLLLLIGLAHRLWQRSIGLLLSNLTTTIVPAIYPLILLALVLGPALTLMKLMRTPLRRVARILSPAAISSTTMELVIGILFTDLASPFRS